MDIGILIILGLSVVYGVYHGFLHTLLSVVSVLAAVFLAVTFGPVLSDALQSNQGLVNNMVTFTDAVTRVGDVTLAQTPAAGLTDAQAEEVISSVKLPDVLSGILRSSLKNTDQPGSATVNDYVSKTVVNAAVRVLCCVAVFAVSALGLTLLTGLIAGVAKFPLLKTADFLAGGLFGLARGAVIVYVIFLLLPIVSTVLPQGVTQAYLDGSRLAGLFSSDGFFIKVIQGRF